MVFGGRGAGGEDRGTRGLCERESARDVPPRLFAETAGTGGRAGGDECWNTAKDTDSNAGGELEAAFDRAGRARVGVFGWRRRDETDDMQETLWFEGLCHTDHGAKLVAGSVVGRLC